MLPTNGWCPVNVKTVICSEELAGPYTVHCFCYMVARPSLPIQLPEGLTTVATDENATPTVYMEAKGGSPRDDRHDDIRC